MALAGTNDEPASSPPSPSEPEFFRFDGDGHSPKENTSTRPSNGANDSVRRRPSATDISKVISGSAGVVPGTSASAETFKEDVRITFALVTSVEWVELGSRVLVMPGVSMATLSNGVAVGSASASGNGIVPMSGLEGFVGTVCEVVAGRCGGGEE